MTLLNINSHSIPNERLSTVSLETPINAFEKKNPKKRKRTWFKRNTKGSWNVQMVLAWLIKKSVAFGELYIQCFLFFCENHFGSKMIVRRSLSTSQIISHGSISVPSWVIDWDTVFYWDTHIFRPCILHVMHCLDRWVPNLKTMVQ